MSKSHRRDPALNRLRHRIVANRRGKRRGWHRRVLHLQHLIAKRVARRHGLRLIVVFDGVPMTIAQKLFLIDCAQHGWHGVAVSVDRRDNAHTTRLLHRLGLHTQAEIIRLHAEGVPGYGPADPVNRSSHCLRSDGVSYSDIPPGGHLPHTWMLGMDVTEWDQLLAVAHRLGYSVVQPYPGTAEAHHVNLRRDPKARLVQRGRI